MTSPYDNLPAEAFWQTAVARRHPLEPGAIYRPRLRITHKTRIVTAGSCFARHVGDHLLAAGYAVQDAEPLVVAVPDTVAQRFGFRSFSARWGNIYTMRQMLQIAQQAVGDRDTAPISWERNGRFHDALRPAIEPDGLDSPEDVAAHRTDHLAAVRRLLEGCDVLVFTLGLTEAWIDRRDGTVYPSAPGVIAGDWNPGIVAFHNFTMREIVQDFVKLRTLVMTRSPRARFLLTVSPVPLTATFSGDHVEVATARSKAVLRAACAELRDRFRNVDYFPSYEIITSVTARSVHYGPNMRSVTPQGVAVAMKTFIDAHKATETRKPVVSGKVRLPGRVPFAELDDPFCDDALLEAFAP